MGHWVSMAESRPHRDGRYWVFPYRSVGGYLMVTLATLKDGEWVSPTRQKEFAFWKTLEIPKPPYLKKSKVRDYEEPTDGSAG